MIESKQLLEMAEKSPNDLSKLLKSCFIENKNIPDSFIGLILLKLIQKNPSYAVLPCLSELIETISLDKGIQSAYNILTRLEVMLDFRKPSIGIYDCALHFIGGAQKYGCTIAHALQNEFDITLITNRNITLDELQRWYNLELSRCRLKIIKIPFFEEKKQKKIMIDPADVDLKKDNPFHIISKESGNYDIFVNNCMLEMVYPLANISLFICHFPEREISRFFYVSKYTEIIYNSLYTAEWIKKRWKLVPHKHIYPPVDMEGLDHSQKKENIILTASRFDLSGNKQQLEIIRSFKKFVKQYPKNKRDWKLILAGGSIAENQYLEKIKKLISLSPGEDIELKVNVSADELKTIYKKAKIFWHFTGFNQYDPARVEHFGMTIAEAMQNGCVPIVFNGGGQTEIVEDGVSGFLFSSEKELFDKTIELIKNQDLLVKIGKKAFQRGKQFNKDIFIAEIKTHFNQLLKEYRSIKKNNSIFIL